MCVTSCLFLYLDGICLFNCLNSFIYCQQMRTSATRLQCQMHKKLPKVYKILLFYTLDEVAPFCYVRLTSKIFQIEMNGTTVLSEDWACNFFYLLFSINCKKNFEKCFFFKQVEIFKLEGFFKSI